MSGVASSNNTNNNSNDSRFLSNQKQLTGGSKIHEVDPMTKYDEIAVELGVGLDRWTVIRKAWQTGGNNNSAPSRKKNSGSSSKNNYDKYVDVDSVVEHLVNPRKPAFKHPVPLPEMIVILNELWEADGLYDN